MTIASEITKLNNNLTNCYTAITNKGGVLPASQNFDNLANTIVNIPSDSTLLTVSTNKSGMTLSEGDVVSYRMDNSGNVEVISPTSSFGRSCGVGIYHIDNGIGYIKVLNYTMNNYTTSYASNWSADSSFILDQKTGIATISSNGGLHRTGLSTSIKKFQISFKYTGSVNYTGPIVLACFGTSSYPANSLADYNNSQMYLGIANQGQLNLYIRNSSGNFVSNTIISLTGTQWYDILAVTGTNYSYSVAAILKDTGGKTHVSYANGTVNTWHTFNSIHIGKYHAYNPPVVNMDLTKFFYCSTNYGYETYAITDRSLTYTT